MVILEYSFPATQSHRQSYKGKFLQLVLRDQEYLLFAPTELHRYHNQILSHFLEDNAISYQWITDVRLEVDYPELVVIGGGRFCVDTVEKALVLWDNSQIYGRFDERALAEKIGAASHPWSSFNVTIG